jgi:hypothetical protein
LRQREKEAGLLEGTAGTTDLTFHCAFLPLAARV